MLRLLEEYMCSVKKPSQELKCVWDHHSLIIYVLALTCSKDFQLNITNLVTRVQIFSMDVLYAA